MRAKLKGRTFLARGGNGKTTRQQEAIAQALGLPMEYAIPTAPVAGQFPSLPPSYKVDLACPEKRLAIVVDGRSHNSPKWKFLDRRKTEILCALGWSVLRFSNREVDTNLTAVLATIRTSMT
jgi:hypothetical protein